MKPLIAFCCLSSCLIAACSKSHVDRVSEVEVPPRIITVSEPPVEVKSEKVTRTYRGEASWYSIRTNGGTRTASGEPLSDSALTAAHRFLLFGTRVRVTNVKNGKSVIVRITDRGPFIKDRIIDLSFASAKRVGMINAGVVPAQVEVLEK